MMSDQEIKDAIESGQLVIEPFFADCLQPSSYDLSLGGFAYLSGKVEKIDVEHKDLDLLPGQFALVITYEKLKMPADIAGYIGISSRWTRKGLLLLHGLQIDPGFEGRLVLGLFNASPRPLKITYKERFCTVSFHKLGLPSERPYESSSEQVRGVIPGEDVRYIQKLPRTRTIAELDQSIDKLEKTIDGLSDRITSVQEDLTSQISAMKDELKYHFNERISTLQTWVQWGGAILLGIFTLFAGAIIYFLFDLARAIQ